MSDATRSSSDLERDVEKRRSEVDGTIQELKERLSPEAAADYGMNYLRGPGGQRLLGAVRDNPLAAALALGGLGWLLFTASQPEEERRRRQYRGRPRVRAYEEPDDLYLRESDLVPDEVSDPLVGVPDRRVSTVSTPSSAASEPGLGTPTYGSGTVGSTSGLTGSAASTARPGTAGASASSPGVTPYVSPAGKTS